MIYLLLSILCSTLIVLIFRAFPKYGIQSFQAIVFNYVVCIILGLVVTHPSQIKLIPNWSGLLPSIALGAFFIFLFYAIARTTQELGVAVASVAQKLSFIVPVIAGILVFNEGSDILKILGILLGIAAVFLISVKSQTSTNEREEAQTEKFKISPSITLPLIVFLGSGASDLTVKIIQTNHLNEHFSTSTFTVVLFISSFIAGTFRLMVNKATIEHKNITAGLILGFPNYGAVYFLILALQKSGLESSQVFPINNVSIILVSALAGWLIFKEHLKIRQLIGLAIAIIAILILI